MTLTLAEYCTKHNYNVIEVYITEGEVGSHKRALVEDKDTKERFRLYYDITYYKRSLEKQRLEYQKAIHKGHPYVPSRNPRGWRNTTLDRRRSIERYNKRMEDSVNKRLEDNT